MAKKLVLAMATGFGLGYSPVASGTVGSLLGVGLVFAMQWLPGLGWEIAVCAVLSLLAIPICGYAEAVLGKKDDGRIVADEYLTFPICMLGLPWVEHPALLASGFVLARAFDIVKPPPANQSQALQGGLGVAMDDIVATLYALAANHLVWRLIYPWVSEWTAGI